MLSSKKNPRLRTKATNAILSSGFICRLALIALLGIGHGYDAGAQSASFGYTGGVQTYTVPTTGTLEVDIVGAQGGNFYSAMPNVGGLGGRVRCKLSVTAGQVLNIYVGGQGQTAGSAVATSNGGYNGGGKGGGWTASCCYVGGGGGGATDIRIGGAALSNRVLVAGGGGGAGYGPAHGFYTTQPSCPGGGLTGGGNAGCGGGTQSGGGSGSGGGSLGNGGNASNNTYCGGGGGGYYGGGAPYNDYAGGGGSSYTSATLCSDVVHTQGYNAGNGYIIMGYGCLPPITTVSAGSTRVCSGTSSILTAAGATTYSWAPASGLSATTGASVTATPTVTTTYTVTGANDSCYSTATVTVSVNPASSSYIVAAPSLACLGSSVSFSDSAASCSGTALQYSAAAHTATLGSIISTAVDNFTMESWVKFNGATAAYQIITYNGNPGADGYGLIIPPSSTSIQLLRGGLSFTATGLTLSTSGWHHLALQRNAGNWCVFIDGTKYAFTDGAPSTPTSNFLVGNSLISSQQFNGTLDEVKYWNTVRTIDEVLADMDPCNSYSSANLLGYWKFNEGSGSSAIDASGHGNTLTVSGPSWVSSGANTPTYSWSFGDGATSTATTVSHAYTALGTFVPSMSVTSPIGCASTFTSTVTVSNMSNITGSTFVCLGGSSTLSCTPAGGAWASSGTGIAAVSGSGVVSGIAAGTATITYTALSGCVSTTVVTVAALDSDIVGTSDICLGASIAFSCSVSGGTWSSANPSLATVNSTSGMVTAMSSGAVTISYSLGGSCYKTFNTHVNSLPLSIYGVTATCKDATTFLICPATGGAWQTTDTTIASVNMVTGVVRGLSAGTAIISYTMLGCSASKVVTVLPTPAAISGISYACTGTTTTLSNDSTGGTWSVANPTVAAIGSGSGLLTGLSAGTSRVSYTTANGCYSTLIATVNTLPLEITGASQVCVGDSLSLSNAVAGGAWSSSAPATASVNGITGTLLGLAPGVVTVSYTLATGCVRTRDISVNALPSAITGDSVLCMGHSVTLSIATSGGSWSSGNSAIATIHASLGSVTGISSGTTGVTYTSTQGCIAQRTVTVNGSVAPIDAPYYVCLGQPITFTDSVSGGSWSSSNTSKATVDAASGLVTGLSVGYVVITYTLGGGCYTTKSVMVSSLPGTISGSSMLCMGSSATYSISGAAGGTWCTSSPTVAVIGSTTAIAAALSAGTVTVSYTSPTGCAATKELTVDVMPGIISGPSVLCVGAAVTLGCTPSGGSWATSYAYIATAGTGGVVTGNAVGNATITYTTAAGCRATKAVTVQASPSAITGGGILCVGNELTFASSPAGGSWSSDNVDVAALVATGKFIGVATGATHISYTASNGCTRTMEVTVNPALPAGIGDSQICLYGTSLYSNPMSGGSWSSSNTVKAVVNAAGLVTGIGIGTANISYKVGAGCYTMRTVSVNAALPVIYGPSVVYTGGIINLTNSVSGGAWSSSAGYTAEVSDSGEVRGISTGSATITYGKGGCIRTKNITVLGSVASRPESTSASIDLFTIHPNPTTGAVVVSSNEAGEMGLYTISGQYIKSFVVQPGANDFSIAHLYLAPGIYVCRFISHSGKTTSTLLEYK